VISLVNCCWSQHNQFWFQVLSGTMLILLLFPRLTGVCLPLVACPLAGEKTPVTLDSLTGSLLQPILSKSESHYDRHMSRPVRLSVRRPFGTRDQFCCLLEIFF
jgi:hypothetical protein